MNDLQEWGEMKLESPRGWIWADFSGVGDPESDSEDEEEDDDELQRNSSVPPPPVNNGTSRNDMSSDSENNAPHPRFPPTQVPPEDAMQVDPQTNTPLTYLIGTPQDLQHHAVTPTLARPTPRLPFAALSPNNNNNPQSTSQRRRPPRMPVLRAHLVQIKILENHQNGKDTHLRGLQIFARNDEELSRAEPKTQTGNGMKTLMGEDVVFKSNLVMGAGREKGARKPERWQLGAGSRSAWDVEPSIR